MTTTSRGYGWREHAKPRQAIARAVAAGTALCVRCHRLILPGTPWDYGHSDDDRSIHTGPEHRHCNRSVGGRNGARVTNALKAARARASTWQW